MELCRDFNICFCPEPRRLNTSFRDQGYKSQHLKLFAVLRLSIFVGCLTDWPHPQPHPGRRLPLLLRIARQTAFGSLIRSLCLSETFTKERLADIWPDKDAVPGSKINVVSFTLSRKWGFESRKVRFSLAHHYISPLSFMLCASRYYILRYQTT